MDEKGLNIDMLLDEEVNKIEDEISNKFGKQEIKEESELRINEPLKIKDPGRSGSKAELIQKYYEMCKVAGREPIAESKLKRFTKAEITKLMAEIMNQEIAGEKVAKKEDGREERIAEMNPENLNLMAEGLFQMNLAFCSLLETGSEFIKEKTYDVALLKGWADKISERRAALINIFKQIYADYKETIDKVLSPIVQWTIVMGQTGTSVMFENIQKKNSIFEEK